MKAELTNYCRLSFSANVKSPLPVSVGSDLCMVSAAMMGLQALLLPLEWVAPTISILPRKLMEFLECPVPLMAGLIVEIAEPQIIPTGPLPSESSSASFTFPPHELKSDGSKKGAGVARKPSSKIRTASLRAARLLQRCG